MDLRPATIIIRDEIRQNGPISFARFMELALYAPGAGYYEQDGAIGRRGDFFTSVSVGSVFGELLAFQFSRWLEKIPPPLSGKLQIVEAGAHDGQLAFDVLHWLRQHRADIFANVEYCVIEPSSVRLASQRTKLAREFSNVKWAADFSEWASFLVRGIIFSNELLDAMPAHRLSWDAAAQVWMECRVDLEADSFVWRKAPLLPELAPYLPDLPAEMTAVLPDGYIIEISPAALRWWTCAAESLARGWLLALDYGFDGADWLRPERHNGTLRTYASHQISSDLLANPGEQDLTAHVNFAAIRAAGERAELRTETFISQAKFLTDIFQRTQTAPGGFVEWSPPRVKQFQTLTHPEHLGHRFRTLVQTRGTENLKPLP